jgi:septum formation protein
MVSDPLLNFKLVLASASPRRRQLMLEAGFIFQTATVDFEEIWPSDLSGKEIAEYLAAGKAMAWGKAIDKKQIIITADTVVWCHNRILGKPTDAAEAAQFLRLLSGCDHEVITALCLRDQTRHRTFSVTTIVTFRELTDEEISFYIDNYRPYDKAGGYGIQEWIGLRGITRIDGSYYNVVGMPVSELYKELQQFVS